MQVHFPTMQSLSLLRSLWPLALLSLACSSSPSGGGGLSGECAALAECCSALDGSLRPTCDAQVESLSQSANPDQACGAAYQGYQSAGMCGGSGSGGGGGFGAFGGFAGASGAAGSAGSATGGTGGAGASASGGSAGTGAVGGFGGSTGGFGGSAGGSSGSGGSTGGFGGSSGGSGGTSGSGGFGGSTGGSGGGSGSGTLLFSEYVEGSSNNKALELFNAGKGSVDLSTCELRRYSNGSTTPYLVTIQPGGIILPGKTFVVCPSKIASAQNCDHLTSSINHNGNDAYEIMCGGKTHDVFGQIGFDPVTAWGAGSTSTADQTLRRKCSVLQGRTNGGSTFNPAQEWTGVGVDVLTGLGTHCGS